ncbi:hypothetical protein [Rhizobacter sp. SG703]|uniref:hypothetical protein n=1 Tax=Rhizobacter sp. SG703 TaxID=2587140 RepID=UPI0014454F0A|nr:hypothetical protein [Rhizobacter sp. SG703]NKI93092.1 hypothetical protein [Rhizobacter sp. SG703]
MNFFKQAISHLREILRPEQYNPLREESSLPERGKAIKESRKKAKSSSPAETKNPKNHKTDDEKLNNDILTACKESVNDALDQIEINRLKKSMEAGKHERETSGNDTDTESHGNSSSTASTGISEKNLVPQADSQSVGRAEPSHAPNLSPADEFKFERAAPEELLLARRLFSRSSESATPDDRHRKSYQKTLADLKEAGLEIRWAIDGDSWSVAVASGEFNNDRHAGLLARAARQFGKDSRNALRAHLLPELYEKLTGEALPVRN